MEEQSDEVDSVQVLHTRVLLLSPDATSLTQLAYAVIEKGPFATHWCLEGIS